MSHIHAAVTVTSDEDTFEITAKQGGAAGVVAATTPDGVEIELDGANTDELGTVRVWHDGELSTAQTAILENLFGDDAAAIINMFGTPRPVRLGTRRSRLSSLRGEEVSMPLSAFVTASDALTRAETHHSVRPLLKIIAAVSARRGGFPHDGVGAVRVATADLELAAAGVHPSGRGLLEDLLREALALDLVAPDALLVLKPAPENEPHVDPLDLVRAAAQHSDILIDAMRVFDSQPVFSRQQVLPMEVARPLLATDLSGLFPEQTGAEWVSSSNIVVTVRDTDAGGVTWWARARRDSDGCIVAVSPLIQDGRHMKATLLAAEIDHLVIDVVGAVGDRVLSPEIGALARAYETGRLAARLERRGEDQAARNAWEKCARLHGMAGDAQRQKMALARDFERRAQSATLIDYLL